MEAVFVFLFGLCFGSFITLASYRLPRGRDILIESSRCTACGKALRPCDLVPVLSWLTAGGRCRHCGTSVHWRYPIIELTTGVLFLLIYSGYGISWNGALLAWLVVMLLIMIVADFEHYLIPDTVHAALLPAGFAWRLLNGAAGWEIFAGLAAGLGLGLALRLGYRALRKKDGLGLGDVKFLAVAGLWLGVMAMVPFLFLSGVMGVVTALVWRTLGKGKIFPFGPALAAALFLCVAFPQVPHAFWGAQEWVLQ